MERAVQAFEIVGVAILAIGSILALLGAVKAVIGGARSTAYQQLRRDVGRSILLGLEILIIADIVETITIDPTLESTAALALIVLVRTFLSFSLEIELEGVVPWRRDQQRGLSRDAGAAEDDHNGSPLQPSSASGQP